MTRSGWLSVGASACLTAGAADIAVLAVWALPLALGAAGMRLPAPAPMTRTAARGPAAPANVLVAPLPSPPTSPSPSRPVEAPQILDSLVVLFASGSAALDEESDLEQLRTFAHAARQFGGLIVIEGHADQRGARGRNLALSRDRARNVAAALEATGVARDRLVVSGYGDRRPRTRADGEANFRLNRRVEIHAEGASR